MNRRRALGLIASGLAAGGLLGGCGQTGPLYLPDQRLEEIKRKKEERDKQGEPEKQSLLEPGAGVAGGLA